jgi:hypothetical protein
VIEAGEDVQTGILGSRLESIEGLRNTELTLHIDQPVIAMA